MPLPRLLAGVDRPDRLHFRNLELFKQNTALSFAPNVSTISGQAQLEVDLEKSSKEYVLPALVFNLRSWSAYLTVSGLPLRDFVFATVSLPSFHSTSTTNPPRAFSPRT